MNHIKLAGTASLGMAMLFGTPTSEYHFTMSMLIALTGTLFAVAALPRHPVVVVVKAGDR